jgi:hypothetical protein
MIVIDAVSDDQAGSLWCEVGMCCPRLHTSLDDGGIFILNLLEILPILNPKLSPTNLMMASVHPSALSTSDPFVTIIH